MSVPDVWFYLDQIAVSNPETCDRIDMVLDLPEPQRTETANQLLHEVWSWFENE